MTTKINAANIENTGVTPGSYINTSITVNEQGQIITASNGVSSGITTGKAIAMAIVFGG